VNPSGASKPIRITGCAKPAPHDEALLRVVSVKQSVDFAEERRLVLRKRVGTGRGGGLTAALDPVFGERMSARPFGDALRFVAAAGAGEELLVPGERAEHAGRGAGIVAGEAEVTDAEIVRFIFLLARIAEREIAGRIARKAGKALRAGDEPHRNHAELAPQRSFLLPLAMVGDDMAELVREHGSELRFAVDDPHQPARQIDVAAWNRKGVDDVAVHQSEGALAAKLRASATFSPMRLR
jgi:hypothetical protein